MDDMVTGKGKESMQSYIAAIESLSLDDELVRISELDEIRKEVDALVADDGSPLPVFSGSTKDELMLKHILLMQVIVALDKSERRSEYDAKTYPTKR